MKKIASILMILVMLFSVSAFGEEEFTLHSGTKFGMTMDEVRSIEEAAGFTVPQGASNKMLQIDGQVAGYSGTIYYYFTDNENGTLDRMEYMFSDSSIYETMEKALEKKYGPTDYNSLRGISLPSFTVNNEEYSFNTRFAPRADSDDITILKCEYSQRIIQISETEYVYIECIREYCRFEPWKWDYSFVSVDYVLLDAETAEGIQRNLKQLDDDL